MQDFDSAIKNMKTTMAKPESEVLDIRHALGRILAAPIRARLDLPPFSKSAMDGFAIQSSDKSPLYEIIETIPAGKVPLQSVGAGRCSRIMTGAMLPDGADVVVRVEYTEVENNQMRIVTPETGRNVISRGENLGKGDDVLDRKIITPQDIGVLSEQGIDRVEVVVPPLVGIITTGSELKDPGESLKEGQIYNSNGFQLCAQVSAMGGQYRYYGAVEDDPESLNSAVSKGISENGVLLLTGGVSMGDYDYVPKVLKELGADIHFHKLAVKPGKPTLFASFDDRYIFGLPGNPVSTFVIFEVVVKPFLYQLLGLSYHPFSIRGRLAESIVRRDNSRLEFMPVRIEHGKVFPVTYHGSSHLHALSLADGLMRIERGVNKLEEGTQVDVRQI